MFFPHFGSSFLVGRHSSLTVLRRGRGPKPDAQSERTTCASHRAILKSEAQIATDIFQRLVGKRLSGEKGKKLDGLPHNKPPLRCCVESDALVRILQVQVGRSGGFLTGRGYFELCMC